jgi:SHS2 domain-containing protein
MAAFELLDHPADIGFRVRARTREGLFANAAFALLSICGDPLAAEGREIYPISVESGDLEGLMVDWLNEVLYFYDGKRIALREMLVGRLEETRIDAVGRGEPRHPERHRAKLIVKAVTYHQLRVAPDAGGWVAEVYVDI